MLMSNNGHMLFAICPKCSAHGIYVICSSCHRSDGFVEAGLSAKCSCGTPVADQIVCPHCQTQIPKESVVPDAKQEELQQIVKRLAKLDEEKNNSTTTTGCLAAAGSLLILIVLIVLKRNDSVGDTAVAMTLIACFAAPPIVGFSVGGYCAWRKGKGQHVERDRLLVRGNELATSFAKITEDHQRQEAAKASARASAKQLLESIQYDVESIKDDIRQTFG